MWIPQKGSEYAWYPCCYWISVILTNLFKINYWTLDLDEDMNPCTDGAADPYYFCVCSDPKPTDPCSIPMDPGTCDGAERRFAYNAVTKRCQVFSYSGCGGNENNFALRKSCMAKCIKGRRGMTA